MNVPDANYTVFVHLRSTAGKTVAQADSPPQAGSYPTSFWDTDETIVDNHTIPLPDNLPAGEYTVVVGLYRYETGERLPITQGASGQEIVLPQTVRISEK
jgi:hypothetical protein